MGGGYETELAAAKTARLGDGPLVAVRDGSWCCLLCERAFKSERHLGKHLSQSELHRGNVAAASAAGRIAGSAKRPAPEPADEAEAHPAKRECPAAAAAPQEAEAPAAKPAGAMSALEQMELFEKRLQTTSKHAPKKEEKQLSNIDSNKARTINNQMDWECGECAAFNFARVVICHACKAPVDHNTKYLTNRLQARAARTRWWLCARLCAPCRTH